MSTDTLNGIVGQPAHFAGDYLFKNKALPNDTTITSEEYTLNNTLGKLLLVGTTDAPLAMEAGNSLVVMLQYKDGNDWKNLTTLFSQTSAGTISAGQIFDIIPTPSNTRRFHRLQVTSNFDASAVKLTAAIEIMPSI